MPDINKFIGNEAASEQDPEGHLLMLEEWSETVAQGFAAEEGIEPLTPKHRDVLNFLRERFREHGPNQQAREIIQALEKRYAGAGGKKFLYQLFPKGPVRQGSRIAGLPEPPGARDASFGTTM
mgnify:CR=1 FL=1